MTPGTIVSERLAHLPREPLVTLPTPLERAAGLGEELGVDLLIKRDDLTGIGCGGNKLRKLEFIAGQAREAGVDTLLTTGGVQSNHARLTAAVAARLGIRCELYLKGDAPGESVGNLLLDRLFSAQVCFEGPVSYDAIHGAMEERAAALRSGGQNPLVVPLGGATAAGTSGYVLAFRELLEQFASPDDEPLTVAVAGGTGSTAAGLALGASIWAPQTRLLVVSVSWTGDVLRGEIDRLFRETAALLEIPAAPMPEIVVDSDHIGPGYAQPSIEGCEALHRFAKREGIVLDSTYTGKAMSGLITHVQRRRIAHGSSVIFIHTGGIPELFTRTAEDLHL